MSRRNLYIIAAVVLLAIVMSGLAGETKDTLISLMTIGLWAGVGLFWLWVYVQSKSRKLFVSKVVVMLVTLSFFIIARHTLRILRSAFGWPVQSHWKRQLERWIQQRRRQYLWRIKWRRVVRQRPGRWPCRRLSLPARTFMPLVVL